MNSKKAKLIKKYANVTGQNKKKLKKQYKVLNWIEKTNESIKMLNEIKDEDSDNNKEK